LEQLIQSLDPAQLSGTVIILPLVNIQSFAQKVPHVNPVDGKSMNRFYPGKLDGTQTERASWLITKQVVERCDYLIRDIRAVFAPCTRILRARQSRVSPTVFSRAA
jgi:predicted deacylase